MYRLVASLLLEAAELLAKLRGPPRRYLRVLRQPRLIRGRWIGVVQYQYLSGPNAHKVLKHIVVRPREFEIELRGNDIFIKSDEGRYKFGEKPEDRSLLRTPRTTILNSIIEESGIEDHDFAAADRAYLEWKKRRLGPKPKAWAGGELDSFRTDGTRFSSLVEAFEHAAKGLKNWAEIDEYVMPLLREVPGFEKARIPEDETLKILLAEQTAKEMSEDEDLPDWVTEDSAT